MGEEKLALDGGAPITTERFPAPWLGTAEIGEEEVEAVAAAVRSGWLFRFLDLDTSHCARLEDLFRNMTGSAYTLAVDGGTSTHICYRYWDYVLEKGSSYVRGWPWTSPRHDPSRTYSPDMCPRTLDILGRTVTITLSQKFEDRHADRIVQGICKVTRGPS